MPDLSFLTALIVIAIAGCGLMAGLFFVFSVSVMSALAQLHPQEGMKAMQLINRTILNPVFLSAFFGTALACVGIVLLSAIQRQAGCVWAIGGAVTYLLGGFLVTASCNVPLNKALDRLAVDAEESPEMWSRYLPHWTRWNHLRTVASIAAVVLLTASLL